MVEQKYFENEMHSFFHSFVAFFSEGGIVCRRNSMSEKGRKDREGGKGGRLVREISESDSRE